MTMTATLDARIPKEPRSETIDCSGGSVRVRELTVAEVRAWLQETAAQEWRDPIHAVACEDIGLDELARMVDCSLDDLEKYAPSQLAPVVTLARKLNPHFFRLRDALIKASRSTEIQAPDGSIQDKAPPSSEA